ncbi:zinc ribbon domain-containing protein [Sphingomonas sp. PB2P12]
MRRCPYCAETVRTEATKCKHCGSQLPPAPKRDIWGRERP